MENDAELISEAHRLVRMGCRTADITSITSILHPVPRPQTVCAAGQGPLGDEMFAAYSTAFETQCLCTRIEVSLFTVHHELVGCLPRPNEHLRYNSKFRRALDSVAKPQPSPVGPFVHLSVQLPQLMCSPASKIARKGKHHLRHHCGQGCDKERSTV